MKGRLRRFRKRLTRLSLIVVTKTIRLLSLIVPYSAGVRIGACIGWISFYALRRERERAETHLAVVYGGRGKAWIRRTARRAFLHLGRALMETMLMSPSRLARDVRFIGEENIRAALSQGRGAVYFTGHIGNWEVMAQAVAARFPLSVVAAPIEPEPVNDLIVGLRARRGVRTILRDRPGASRELIRVVRENRILGILIDQDTDVEGAFVDFLGKPAWTPTAVAQMAVKFNAPVLFGTIHRDADGKHTVRVEGPVPLIVTGDEGKDLVANTERFSAMIASRIQEAPEQWVWMHRRWRRQP